MSLSHKIFWLILIVMITLVIGQLILGGLMIAGGADIMLGSDVTSLLDSMESTWMFKIGVGVNNLLMFAVAALVFCTMVMKSKISTYFNFKSINLLLLGLSLLYMVVSYPLIGYSVNLLSHINFPSWMSSMDEQSIETLMSVLNMNNIGDLILNLFIVAIIPAVGEELLFRGVIQKELKRHMTNQHIAIWITAFVFSAVHLQIEGFPPKFILGLVLGYTYHYTKNIWYPILLHLFNNGSQLIALYISNEEISEIEMSEGTDIHWSIALLSLALSVLMYTTLKNKTTEDVLSA